MRDRGGRGKSYISSRVCHVLPILFGKVLVAVMVYLVVTFDVRRSFLNGPDRSCGLTYRVSSSTNPWSYWYS